jgi:hypothetical protein
MAINRVAAEKIPADMPQFLKAAAAHIAFDGPEPDRWRERSEPELKASQEPDHYLDMEYIEWLQPMPPDRYQYIRAIYERRAQQPTLPPPEKIGFQPYITMEIYGRLVVAFREYRKARKEKQPTSDAEANAIFYAAWLGHYVADGSNPLHTTIHYNGWVGGNPKGYSTAHDLHSRMETAFVQANLKKLQFADMVTAPRRLRNPFDDYLAYLHESHGKVETVYQLEKQHGFDGVGTADSRDFIRQQLARGSQMLLNLWYTAWIASEKEPEPFRLPPPEKGPVQRAPASEKGR